MGHPTLLEQRIDWVARRDRAVRGAAQAADQLLGHSLAVEHMEHGLAHAPVHPWVLRVPELELEVARAREDGQRSALTTVGPVLFHLKELTGLEGSNRDHVDLSSQQVRVHDGRIAEEADLDAVDLRL